MKNTIYASFSDPKLAEKAAGALVDHGLKEEDLSLIEGHGMRLAERNWSLLVGATALLVPGVGLVVGGGELACAILRLASTVEMEPTAAALTGYLKDQGIESQTVAAYEHTVISGGAVLGATLPSGTVDEGKAWEILSKFSGLHVTSYLNRPYLT
jgi:hypothetical protein